ncbi:MAG: hypothetical protein ACRDC6_09475 [Shewanella sp.]
MNIVFRLFLTFNATSLLVIIFLVQKGHSLGYFFTKCPYLPYRPDFIELPNYYSYALYLLVPILLTGISILLSSLLGKDSFKSGDIINIEHANNSFLPSYLGYFFVALSISNWETLWFVYGVLFMFTFRSQALYFNPIFLLFGFDFYNITTKNGAVVFLISRNSFKIPANIDIARVRRINNYTFIER